MTIHDNTALEGVTAIFFVSNDRTGTLRIKNSALWNNPKETGETKDYPGIFYLGYGDLQVINSPLGVVPDPNTTTPNTENKTDISPIIST